jgi:hypothetical protein
LIPLGLLGLWAFARGIIFVGRSFAEGEDEFLMQFLRETLDVEGLPDEPRT